MIESGAGCNEAKEWEREREESGNSQPPHIATHTMVEQAGNSCMYFGFALLTEMQNCDPLPCGGGANTEKGRNCY